MIWKEPYGRGPQELQASRLNHLEIQMELSARPPCSRGKPCVLFCLNTRGVNGNAACMLSAWSAFSDLYFPTYLQWGTWPWVVWGLHHCVGIASVGPTDL